MICPNDGERLNCKNTRQRDGYVSRNYRCPKCGNTFATAEFIRERQDSSKKGRQVRGEGFGAQQVRDLKDKVVDQLREMIARVEAS